MIFLSPSDFEREFPFQKEISEQIHFLLTAAVRAPSTHNCQPWRFRIEHNRLFVYRDVSISLPQSDSTHRYTYISIGFLLHHIMQIGEWLSMEPNLALLMEGERIAEITFSEAVPSGKHPSIIDALFRRRNRRGNFEPKQIPLHILEQAARPTRGIVAIPEVLVITDASAIRRVAESTATVMRRAYARAPFRREMSKWITPTGSRRKDGIPGYSLNQSAIMSWLLPTIIRFVNVGNVLARLNNAAIASAPAAFGFGAPDNPSGWVSVGYAASHVALTLVAHGFDYSVFVASIEYEDTRRSVASVFGLRQPLEFLFVAGTLPGEAAWMTPRVPPDAKLMAS